MRILFGLLFSALLIASCRPDAPPGTVLTILSASGKHAFKIEVADTRESQARGLMFRKSLDADAGMLFVYTVKAPIAMWMKNTYIPLDMLFIDEKGLITHIAERTVPMSTAIIRSNGPVLAVLEVNGGTVSRLGIAKGDRIVSEAFPQR